MDNATDTATGTHEPPPSAPTGATGPRVTRDEMVDLGRLRRSVTNRHVAGVAGGLARHLDIDPIIVRVTLVVATFFGGAGLLAYVGAWILVPEEGTDDRPLGLDQRNRSIGLAGVGLLALLCAVGDWAGASWFPWPLTIVAVIVVLFLRRKDRRAPSGYGYGPQTSEGDTAATTSTYAPASYAPAYAPAGHETAGHETPGYETPAYETAAYEKRRQPRSPRRRGPILFFFTLALIALAEGVLGVVDLAGTSVTGSAYPALALGIIATMLVAGAFWGRAGGLIALGLVAAVATGAATIGDHLSTDRLDYAPTSAAQVDDTYDFGGGELTLDLSGVSDVDALGGRDITIDGVGGRVEVIVPDGVDVSVETQVVAGDTRVFDQHRNGFDVTLDASHDGGDASPVMTITIDLVAGEIIVREAS